MYTAGKGMSCTPFSEMNENVQKSLIETTFFCIYLVIHNGDRNTV